MKKQENIERIIELKEQMLILLEEAFELVPEGIVKERAKYWYVDIVTAILKENDYLGGSMVTIDDTIEELKEYYLEQEFSGEEL